MEVARIGELLERARMLTLVGPPGIGKTRLANEVALASAHRFPDGVWVVALAPVSRPDGVAAAVANALSARERVGRSAGQAVEAAIGSGRALLMIDNCEHLLGACSELVGSLLDACPNLHVVATSQERLALPAEQVFVVGGLALADPGTLPGNDAARSDSLGTRRKKEANGTLDPRPFGPAVELFVERAQAAAAGFALTADTVAPVMEVCRRLDGIPLAIELAAARVAMFPPAEIARRLDDRFAFLTEGSRTALPRHQTLQAAVDWSYDLLAEPEQALLRRLSVFAGGCTLDTASEVCGGGPVAGHEILALMTRLVARSLVVAETTVTTAGGGGNGNGNGGHPGGPTPNGHAANGSARYETRYRLLDTIREYGRHRLADAGETAATNARHLDWCVDLAERAESHITSQHQRQWVLRLEEEHDNFRAALAWGLSEGRVEPVLRLGGALALFWRIRAHFSEGREWLSQALAAAAEQALPVSGSAAAKAMWGQGLLEAMVGNYGVAAEAAGTSLALWERVEDRRGAARSLLLQATTLLFTKGPAAGLPVIQQAIALARLVGDRWCLAQSLAAAGSALNGQGDSAAARPMLEECVTVATAIGDDQCRAFGLYGLGYVARRQADLPSAEAHLTAALAAAQASGSDYEAAMALVDLASVALLRGELDAADECSRAAMAAADATKSTDAQIYAVAVRGRIALARQEFDSADADFAVAASRSARVGRVSAIADRGRAMVALARKNPGTARRYLDKALLAAQATGGEADVADVLHALGAAALLEGDAAQAMSCHREALATRSRLGDRLGMVESVEALATLAAADGNLDQAARAFAAADRERERLRAPRLGAHRDTCSADIERVLDGLGSEAFANACRQGRDGSLADAAAAFTGRKPALDVQVGAGGKALTSSEQSVAALAARGLTNAQIARELLISPNTVKVHMGRVLSKLGLTSRRELTRRLLEGF